MERRFKQPNHGYTLVEMIIVIAIIAVVSAVSTVSITIINSARCKDAALTFDSEVGELQLKCKDMGGKSTPLTDVNGTIYNYKISYKDSTGASKSADGYCYRICVENGVYVIKHGYYTVDSSTGNLTTVFPNADDETKLSSRVVVKYKFVPSIAKDTAPEGDFVTVNGTGVDVCFNYAGQCISGYGVYGFYKKNGNMVAKDYVRFNGSHQSR